jgi:hypothetical protein
MGGRNMSGVILRLGGVVIAFVGLSGFDERPWMPPDYSPHYSVVEVVGPNGRMRRVLVPDSCMTAEEEPSPAVIHEHLLPPGCANAFNLQHMAEKKKDLVRGRKLSRAPMPTAAHAAEKYLSGPGAPPALPTGYAAPGASVAKD